MLRDYSELPNACACMHLCVCVGNTIYYLLLSFMHTFDFVDRAKCGVLTLVGKTPHYRKDHYYYYYSFSAISPRLRPIVTQPHLFLFFSKTAHTNI